jgi:hypothetical protein
MDLSHLSGPWLQIGGFLSVLVWAVFQMLKPQPPRPKRDAAALRRMTQTMLIGTLGLVTLMLGTSVVLSWTSLGMPDLPTTLLEVGAVLAIDALVAGLILLGGVIAIRRDRHR